MSSIFVCPLSALEDTLAQSGARTMIAFGGRGASFDRPAQIDQHYLALQFNDISEPQPGLQPPTADHVAQILSTAKAWDYREPMLLQCWMGISRSTAAAAIVLACLRPETGLDRIAVALRQASPAATPNPLMICHADSLLGLNGRFSEAVEEIGRGAEASQGLPFSLSVNSL